MYLASTGPIYQDDALEASVWERVHQNINMTIYSASLRIAGELCCHCCRCSRRSCSRSWRCCITLFTVESFGWPTPYGPFLLLRFTFGHDLSAGLCGPTFLQDSRVPYLALLCKFMSGSHFLPKPRPYLVPKPSHPTTRATTPSLSTVSLSATHLIARSCTLDKHVAYKPSRRLLRPLNDATSERVGSAHGDAARGKCLHTVVAVDLDVR